MNRKETTSRQSLSAKGPFSEFGRWLCGHSSSEEYLSLYSRLSAVPSFSFSKVSASAQAQDSFGFSQSGFLTQTIDAAQYWRSQNLPSLLDWSDKTGEENSDQPSVRRDFYRYGSSFLRYKSYQSPEKSADNSGSLFFSGNPLAQSLRSIGVDGSLSAVFSRATAVLGDRNPLATCYSLLLRLSSPPELVLDSWTADSPSTGLFPWDAVGRLWSTPVQVTTAIAFAVPVLVTSTQIKPFFALQTASEVGRTAPAETGVASERPVAAPLVKIRSIFKPQKPTGRIANIQSYIFPARGELTSGYGWRWGRMHLGIDIAGPVGTPIVAAAAGKVIVAGWDSTGYGNHVEIQHPDGTVTLYGHNSKLLVRTGMKVRQGQAIGEMGSTGFSTGPHVHFQMYVAGRKAIDPMGFFAGKKLAKLPG